MKQASGSKKGSSHKAKTPWEWKKRLLRFAAGERFGREEKPPHDSQWGKIVSEIAACPAHGGGNGNCVC